MRTPEEERAILEASLMSGYEAMDIIWDLCQQQGYIHIPQSGEAFYDEYRHLPNRIKEKYFRVERGLPMDVWANDARMTVRELLDLLRQYPGRQ